MASDDSYTGPERRSSQKRFDGPPVWDEAERDRKPGQSVLTDMEKRREGCRRGAHDRRVLVDEAAARLMESREGSEDL